jgi:4-amino-4-deoxy-L-arabinose transferase-like glycosyltransferase
MSTCGAKQGLRGIDFLVIGGFCAMLFGYALFGGRPLTGHESVQAELSREMFADHDWLIPKCGGYPWLERPPLPQWMTIGIASAFGRCDRDWIVRLAPIFLGGLVVLLLARTAAGWYGRGVGVLSGLILASMWEFWVYSTDPEADMFLCAIVTGALALFAHLEFFRRGDAGEPRTFFGRRPWPVLALFVLLGMTNLAKGLIFGVLMAGVPVAGYLLANADLGALRRYVWFWGWLAFAVVALSWPVAVYHQYPDIVDLWKSDYLSRLSQGYLREPAWYYAATLPYVLLPWTIPALVGLGVTARAAIRQRGTPERFLWTWAVLTPLVFSIPDGKHHHYLLPCLAPWAVLAALGAVRIWQGILQLPALLRNPYVGLLVIGVPGDVALWLFANRIPGPAWIVPALMTGWPFLVFGMCWAVGQRDGRLAMGSLFGILAVVYGLLYAYQTNYLDGYGDDSDFLRQVRGLVTPDRPLYINFDDLYPLETFHLLFYTDGAKLLHNLTFLLDEHIDRKEVYVLARAAEGTYLSTFGKAQMVLQSRHTRGERSPADRRTLFLLRFRDGLARVPAPLRLSPMQAVHREPGPYLLRLVPPRP